MLQHSWIFLGIVALVATVLTLRTADDQLAIIGGLAGTLAWALWGYSALNVITVSGGTEVAYAYPSMAAFGVAMAIPNLFVALTGPLQIAKNRDELANEVR